VRSMSEASLPLTGMRIPGSDWLGEARWMTATA